MTEVDNNKIIAERLANLQEDVQEIKASIKSVERHQVEDAKSIVLMLGRIENYERRVTRNETQIETLTKTLASLVFQSRIIAWVGSAIGLLVLGLLFAILTGQVSLIFPH